MNLFKRKKLNNTKIHTLYIIPIRNLHVKYGIIIVLLMSFILVNTKLYSIATSQYSCEVGIPSLGAETKRPDETVKLASKVSKLYNISYKDAKEIVTTAMIYSNPTFPTVYDTLAIIGVESHFNPYAISSTGAKGLMQILYKTASFDIEKNINDGVSLLQEYKDKLNSEDAVIQSYNLGIRAYMAGSRNQDYLNNFKETRKKLKQ